MTKREEIKDFCEKVEMLKIVFSDIPEVRFLTKEELETEKITIFDRIYNNGEPITLKGFSEILIVGNSVINVAGNSVSKNLEIVVCASKRLSYNGFLGYLM